ncbi:MAG TPA: hypothetical protein PKZ84_05890 [Anaerolineae bacterium]|nr:hypothetical protein [Anaerolineae bacterium]HQI84084.1 hypothetical protein [Anaerolineae bacterium]
MDTQTVKQEEQVMVVEETRHSEHLWEHFPEPRGYSMRWDGFALDFSAQRNGRPTEYPIEPKGR